METLQEIRLVEAAQRLSLSYAKCLDLVLRGKLAGRQTEGRRWLVSASDVERLAEHLRRYPNLYVEIGNRFPRLASTPRVARKFFIEFQDRILFGMDGIQPTDQYRARFRILETDDDAFQLPGRETDFQRLYGLDLPDVVLKKVYYSNAAKLMPKVKRALLKQHPNLDFPK